MDDCQKYNRKLIKEESGGFSKVVTDIPGNVHLDIVQALDHWPTIQSVGEVNFWKKEVVA